MSLAPNFKTGDRVEHAYFGRGTVRVLKAKRDGWARRIYAVRMDRGLCRVDTDDDLSGCALLPESELSPLNAVDALGEIA